MKVPQVLTKNESSEILRHFGQGPARDQRGTKLPLIFKCAIVDDKKLFIYGYTDFKNTTFDLVSLGWMSEQV